MCATCHWEKKKNWRFGEKFFIIEGCVLPASLLLRRSTHRCLNSTGEFDLDNGKTSKNNDKQRQISLQAHFSTAATTSPQLKKVILTECSCGTEVVLSKSKINASSVAVTSTKICLSIQNNSTSSRLILEKAPPARVTKHQHEGFIQLQIFPWHAKNQISIVATLIRTQQSRINQIINFSSQKNAQFYSKIPSCKVRAPRATAPGLFFVSNSRPPVIARNTRKSHVKVLQRALNNNLRAHSQMFSGSKTSAKRANRAKRAKKKTARKEQK